jgi:hypothetical protein
MKYFLLSFFLITSITISDSFASTSEDVDDAKVDTTVSLWNLGGWATLNGSQASFRNWAQGGVNNIAGTSTLRFTAEYKEARFIYNNALNMKYGKTKIGSNDFRKTDDEFRVRNQLRYLLDDPRFSLIAHVNFNTQLDKGYDSSNKVVISKFMAPGYLIETVGFAFNPKKGYQFDLGISLKQTVVIDTLLSRRYGIKSGERFKNEGGISIGVKIERDIATNVNLSSQLDTFTNYVKPVNSTTIRFSNEIIGKINSYLSANVQFAFVYDDNITNKWQVKQVLSIGFSYRFI